jgi:phage terminase small subunit
MAQKKHQQAVPEPYPEAPEHLSERSKGLWITLGPTKARTMQRRTLFQAALEALDRADQARAVIAAEGMTTTTKTTGALHIHPLVKVEREARSQFSQIWTSMLGLNSDFDNNLLGSF